MPVLYCERGTAGQPELQPPMPTPGPHVPICCPRASFCVQVMVREVAVQALCPRLKWPRKWDWGAEGGEQRSDSFSPGTT